MVLPCVFSLGDVKLTYFGRWTGLQYFSDSALLKTFFVAPGMCISCYIVQSAKGNPVLWSAVALVCLPVCKTIYCNFYLTSNTQLLKIFNG